MAEIYEVKNNDKFFKPIKMADCEEDDEEMKEQQKPRLYIEVYLEKLIEKDIITEVQMEEIIQSL